MLHARRRAPLWFDLLFFTVAALLLYWVARHLPAPPHAGVDAAPPVQYAFFAAFIAIVEAIWSGIQAFADVTLAALAYTVNFLWAAMSRMGSWALEIGRDTIAGFRQAWAFLRTLYDDVLKPAWQKFWKVIDWARRTLDDLFAPVFRFLRKIREQLLAYYEHFVRPVLDTIELARRILQIFSKLGFEWAKTLDAQLARIEDKISTSFLFVLAKLNDVITVVNRVVTADGLLQRLALIKSIERDARFVYNQLQNLRRAPLTDAQLKALVDAKPLPTLSETATQFIEYSETRGGPMAEWVERAAGATLALPPLRP